MDQKSDKMHGIYCALGHKNSAEAQYCNTCGELLRYIYCGVGHRNLPGARICSQCGTQLHWVGDLPIITVQGTDPKEVQEVTLALLERTTLLSTSSNALKSDTNKAEAKTLLDNPIKIFFCYAHKDEMLLNKLKTHLVSLKRLGLIDFWHDRDINAGTEWEREISDQLNLAQIILLLISPDFMNSNYCYSVEMKYALERHKRGEARVISVILRPVLWRETPIGKLQVLPTGARPITDPYWVTQDRGFHKVAEGINIVVKQWLEKSTGNQSEPHQAPSSIYMIEHGTRAYLCYCSKCKQKTEMKDAQKTTTKNGQAAVKGLCAICGTNVYLILGREKRYR